MRNTYTESEIEILIIGIIFIMRFMPICIF